MMIASNNRNSNGLDLVIALLMLPASPVRFARRSLASRPGLCQGAALCRTRAALYAVIWCLHFTNRCVAIRRTDRLLWGCIFRSRRSANTAGSIAIFCCLLQRDFNTARTQILTITTMILAARFSNTDGRLLPNYTSAGQSQQKKHQDLPGEMLE